jgi:hypothetical protein
MLSDDRPWWRGWEFAGLMLAWIVVLVVAIWFGGLVGVSVWYFVRLVLPTLGLWSIAALTLRVVRGPRPRIVPAVVTALIAVVALIPALQFFGYLQVIYPASIARYRPHAYVRVPANVPLKVLWGGDRLPGNNHAALPAQRWAYDLLVAPFLVGSDVLEDYGCFGVTVVAPASGRVVVARDGAPDRTPGDPDPADLGGNQVVIELASRTYLQIAHLKQGSVAVSEGQMVHEGQPIGQCGNSGRSTEPHIHLNHQLNDPRVYPGMFAVGLPLFFRDHYGPPMPEGGIRFDGERPVAVGHVVRHGRRR